MSLVRNQENQFLCPTCGWTQPADSKSARIAGTTFLPIPFHSGRAGRQSFFSGMPGRRWCSCMRGRWLRQPVAMPSWEAQAGGRTPAICQGRGLRPACGRVVRGRRLRGGRWLSLSGPWPGTFWCVDAVCLSGCGSQLRRAGEFCLPFPFDGSFPVRDVLWRDQAGGGQPLVVIARGSCVAEGSRLAVWVGGVDRYLACGGIHRPGDLQSFGRCLFDCGGEPSFAVRLCCLR